MGKRRKEKGKKKDILYVFDYDNTLMNDNFVQKPKKRETMFGFFSSVKKKHKTKILTARYKPSCSKIEKITGLPKKDVHYKKNPTKSISDEKSEQLEQWSKEYKQICFYDDKITKYGYDKKDLSKNIALFNENGVKISKNRDVCKNVK
jgi:hydroxymethylpyrimidine pyrophosphatase-like HAD family hydrolase